MQLNILIFDSDPSIRRLLKTCLSEKGHRVQSFPDLSFCDLYQRPACICPKTSPCADVIIADIRTKSSNSITFLNEQLRQGCKTSIANKAIMSASMTNGQRELIEALGCHPIKKPFRLNDILTWVDECADRLKKRNE